MMSQPEQQITAIHRKNHVYTKYGGETIPRSFSKLSKLSISLD